MIGTIEHNNGTMTVTTKSGDVAKRKTNNQYQAAIVGRNKAGKLVVCFASWTDAKALEAMAKVAAGTFVNHKFTGVTSLEMVRMDAGWIPEDPAVTFARDAERIAAYRAKKAA